MLVVRIAKNHPLPDGNKRPAWQSLIMFCILDGHTLQVPTNDVVQLMLAVAAVDFSETDVAAWLTDRLQPLDSR